MTCMATELFFLEHPSVFGDALHHFYKWFDFLIRRATWKA